MSLKTFHLFFLMIAVLFDFGFAAYSFYGPDNAATREIRSLGLGIGSGLFGILLLAYGVWFFWKKAPKIIV